MSVWDSFKFSVIVWHPLASGSALPLALWSRPQRHGQKLLVSSPKSDSSPASSEGAVGDNWPLLLAQKFLSPSVAVACQESDASTLLSLPTAASPRTTQPPLSHPDSDTPTKDSLQRRLRLRDILRDEQLFEQLLPRGTDPKLKWTAEGPVKTVVDHWSPSTQFIAMDTSRFFFSSALSGFVVSALGTPFDVVKNYWIYSPRLHGTRTNLATADVVRSIYETGGFRAFYTGFGATCCTVIPSNLIFFTAYEQFRQHDVPAIAGVKARIIAAVLTSPCEYYRTRLQANAGTSMTFSKLLKTIVGLDVGSVLGRGVAITLLRDAPFSAVYWTLNEKGKQLLAKKDPDYANRSTFRTKFVYPFLSGAISAAVASSCTQPFDVIKTNMQANETIFRRRGAYYFSLDGIVTHSTQIYKSQGIAGFFVGLIPRLAKIIPSCAVLLSSYDFTKALLTSDRQEDLYDFERV